MAKLWQKTYTIHELIESFTVGQDYILDLRLVRSDCMGSIAHIRGLQKVGLLSSTDLESLEAELRKIAQDAMEGRFHISVSDEDCHTRIEGLLTERLGEAGKRVHLGRSRNDQILTALRLYGKDMLIQIRLALADLVDRLLDFAERYRDVPMPGRTHMQIAMPSTLGLWTGAFAEQLLDDAELVNAAWKLTDRSPLGAAASYGVPLPLDRAYTCAAMGFADLYRNPLGANNTRGKIEAAVLDSLDHIGLSLSKMAQDLILFSLPEFGYFSLPDELTSGSSIMPQKKNPDGLELIRSRAGSLSGWATQAKNVIRSLPSGYNRDFQDTKEPYLRGLSVALDALRVMDLSFEKLIVHPEKLQTGLSPEIFATDDAIDLVDQGMSFRDAYKEVGMNLGKVKARNLDKLLDRRRSLGYAGNLGIDVFRDRCAKLRTRLAEDADRHLSAVENLLGAKGRLAN